ncbi:hypothetical protein PENSPDRAFT_689129 [Peniophora sp. CONT]|nr:hypothetical protein PENSPDRAFT_689129 [Peniophora sp. CONT]
MSNGSLPHITWCPTGPLCYLPLHAAGVYSDPLGPRVYDFVVSSYVPSLAALLRCYNDIPETTPQALIVTQPATPGHSPLRGTVDERSRLATVFSESNIRKSTLDDAQATVDAVQVSWSAFALYNGPLTLAKLMSTMANDAELAFLSACQTAVGDSRTPEESAHLGADMLAVGFKGVVATTWSIVDNDAPVVVEAYYKELLALRNAGSVGKDETGAAYALHEATRVLREKVGVEDFARWVSFVHFGV